MRTATKMLGLVVLAMVSGCVKAPIQGRADPYPPNQINFAQDSLRRDTAVGTPIVNRDPEGQILFVTIPIRAAKDQQLYVDYRFTFLDPYGQVVSQTGWMTRTLAPNVFDQVQGNSTSPRAADFRVDFRWAR